MNIITWILAAMSLIGTWLVIKKRLSGFYLWAATNIGWVAIDLRSGVYGQAVMFTVYFFLSLYGIWEWMREKNKNQRCKENRWTNGRRSNG